MANHVFCRDLCLERGEPHEGTGNAPHRALLLAWPRGKWRTPRWESADMSEALAASIHNAAKKGLHVALVDRVGESAGLPQLMAQPEQVCADFESEAALIAAIDDYADGKVFSGTSDPRITIIVCTDSRRDACCARYGFSTYKALAAVADPAKFHIVQATHIGGCRFAASLVVMPYRQRYGRMTAGQAAAFIEALSRGQIFLPAYKGRTDEPEPIQVAELAALKWAADNDASVSSVRLSHDALPESAKDGDELVLSAALDTERLSIHLRARTFHIQGNCGVVAEGGGSHEIRWCLDHLSRAS
ncbi:sucrase ferredoxin [Pelagibacterium halotolerans]|uniref:Sucraseferredoxin family protein n=1 Tax=Pelagibacterium halotolerans (strain DSM 22347 / JCM 15775 / CGMCC 1.7692 / B2) TaxID=1082931 RepID=G4R8B2_PELHB|nr:sucrase ferredoxin [Pelagibacterium halotolerans]AEQ52356.1 hypothetical protein KKY_2347 [Pelagibacterium halotolerans B2]QJR17905.1 hypothetical protein HKM20_05305 [Pelagibacterium halotolerans]SEA34169.1 hypothetical protein SAMN05428936_10395 [Pelagibacterium halotolerans]